MDTSITPPAVTVAAENHDPAGEPAAVAGLPDDPALEQKLADARRAALESADVPPLDPLGLYALEVEREEALDDLAAHLPADASIRLARHAIVQRFGGLSRTRRAGGRVGRSRAGAGRVGTAPGAWDERARLADLRRRPARH